MNRSAALILLGALSSCQSVEARHPAVLVRADAATMAALEAALAGAMGVARVDIGASDLTRSPAIPVLPAPPSPLEGRSPAEPVLFDLAMRGGSCLAVRRASGEEIKLRGVSCRPLEEGG